MSDTDDYYEVGSDRTDDEVSDQLNGSSTVYKTVAIDYKYRELIDRITKKIIDLQTQLITAYTDKTSTIAETPQDIVRYTAMVDVLKAILR